MARDLILGTAGHIDHGKTALVKALTGTDCDRLPEEKARGITIDIGFARLDLGDFRLGVVDVPGHERFVKNMLAGATGIDLALLVVAADDGGDAADPRTPRNPAAARRPPRGRRPDQGRPGGRRPPATWWRSKSANWSRGTFLADAPIVPTSAATGAGLDELRAALAAALPTGSEPAPAAEPFRLADRPGVRRAGARHRRHRLGDVAAAPRVGDELDWRRGASASAVRSAARTTARPSRTVRRGQRAGGQPARGAARARSPRPGTGVARLPRAEPRLTVRLHRLDAEPAGRSNTGCRCGCTLGTAEVMATVSLLDADELEPGQWGAGPTVRRRAGDGRRGASRSSSATRRPNTPSAAGRCSSRRPASSAGGTVEVLEHLERLWSPEPAERVAAAAWFGRVRRRRPGRPVRGAGVGPDRAPALVADCVAAGTLVAVRRAGRAGG